MVYYNRSGWHDPPIYINVESELTLESPKHLSNKDTRKWCRGKVGQEHNAVWQYWMGGWTRDPDGDLQDYQRLKCTECGKMLSSRTVPSNRPSHGGIAMT